jgi:hypothetical protein
LFSAYNIFENPVRVICILCVAERKQAVFSNFLSFKSVAECKEYKIESDSLLITLHQVLKSSDYSENLGL